MSNEEPRTLRPLVLGSRNLNEIVSISRPVELSVPKEGVTQVTGESELPVVTPSEVVTATPPTPSSAEPVDSEGTKESSTASAAPSSPSVTKIELGSELSTAPGEGEMKKIVEPTPLTTATPASPKIESPLETPSSKSKEGTSLTSTSSKGQTPKSSMTKPSAPTIPGKKAESK